MIALAVNLKQLEYFVKVAELGSFSRAAVLLDIAQPALSRQVRALETDLRETLLLRNGRGVALTEAGRRYHSHCRRLMGEASARTGWSLGDNAVRASIGLGTTTEHVDRLLAGIGELVGTGATVG